MNPSTLDLLIAAFALVQAVRYGPRALRFVRALGDPAARRALRPADAIPAAVVLVCVVLLASSAAHLLR